MKNVIKYSKKGILMVTLLATLLSSAHEVSLFTIKNEAEKISLTLNVKKGNLLSIKDDNGIVLYKEHIQKEGVYTKGFDLTSLPNGSYIFELDKDMEISIIPFSVNASLVSFKKEEEKTIFKPFVRIKDDIVYVTQLTVNKAPLKIDMFFAEGNDFELVYSENIENIQDIKKVFKLSRLNEGRYKLVLHSEGREYEKIIQ
ncbi:hypothetical protein ACFFU9_01990 [Mariniflexile ostreae]|uniref:Secreted protein (Por secretion system target) n=1 Tax=Mariniflexile ostreae TaxID=1520892 RepID=A0ABV5F7T7_9FLAO